MRRGNGWQIGLVCLLLSVLVSGVFISSSAWALDHDFNIDSEIQKQQQAIDEVMPTLGQEAAQPMLETSAGDTLKVQLIQRTHARPRSS